MKKINILQNIPNTLKDELFEDIIKSDTIRVERIVSQGHISPDVGWYESSQNEWVILLEGSASLTFESGEILTLASGDYINIPALKRHKVSYTSSSPKAIWLAIYY